jgi:hypothetical protein
VLLVWLNESCKFYPHVALETFAGAIITAKEVVDFINTPENVLLLQHDAHQEYYKDFAWGIEAVCEDDSTVSFQFRAIVNSHLLYIDSLLHSVCPSGSDVQLDKTWHG